LEAPDDAVLHRMQSAPAAGARVQGRIDADRRRDHMQQHSGQHLLSATAIALFDRDTGSFHLGTERCSIDLPGRLFTLPELRALERRANEIIWEARPVRARFLASEEHALLRKAPPEGVGPIRVIDIEGWDLNACCGTHVERTSAIGCMKIFAQEKVGDAARIAFACGHRALALWDESEQRVDALVRQFTCHPGELVERAEKLVQENKSLRKAQEKLAAQAARGRAAELVAKAERAGGVPLVVYELEAGESLADLARAVVDAGAVALLGAKGTRADLLFQRPDALDLDLRPVLAAASTVVEGRGGGPAGRVQGAGPRVDRLPQALATARLAAAEKLDRPS
jgi:alanyl-tRNA synthetase